jgi:hypothetical protein
MIKKIIIKVKGSLTRDFRLQVFFHKSSSHGPPSIPVGPINIHSRISPRIFEKFLNDLIGILRGPGKKLARMAAVPVLVPGLLGFRVELLQPGVEGGERCPPLHLLLLLCHFLQSEKPTFQVSNSSPTLIKKKIKFSSYIRIFRMEQLQSHI